MDTENAEKTSQGLVVLVGAGPGEAKLITVAGAEWLSRADVVVYDNLVSLDLLKACRTDAEKIYAGKRPGQPSMSQRKINALLVEKGQEGKLVVRLKGGDPFLFGRGSEEIEALKEHDLAFRVVPGVTAALAAGAYAGIPLTDRRTASMVVFVTGHEDPDQGESSINWESLAWADTVVFYMGVGNLSQICEQMMMVGRYGETPAAVVERAATPRQRTVISTLESIADEAEAARIRPPAIVIIGDVAEMTNRLDWYEALPLYGVTVAVTRSEDQALTLAAKLGELGAEAVIAPAIRIEPPEDYATLDAAVRRLGEFDWVVLTSPNGAASLFARIDELGLDTRAFGGVKMAAVGEATANALRERSIIADLVPEAFTTEALGKALQAGGGLSGKKVLLPRADIAPTGLAESLRASGASVEEVTAYRTVKPDALDEDAIKAFKRKRVDWISFTSSSTVENFLALAEAEEIDVSELKIAAIGPVTADTLRARGLEPTVVADPHTIDALGEAILAEEKPPEPPAEEAADETAEQPADKPAEE